MKSWDCFDTLVSRKYYHPYSVFEEVGNRLGIENFKKIRLKAEKESDGTIEGIYKNLPGIDPDVEFNVELEHCFGIVHNIKKVEDGDIIVSDMYFTSEQIRKILDNCGLKKKVKIYVTPAGKKYGSIWTSLGKIELHTGDNLRSDVESPLKFGIKSSHYTDFQFNKIEEYISNIDFELACWSRYIRLQCPFDSEYEVNLWNDQANLNLPVLLLASLELPENEKIAFCYRDCAYWQQIYNALTGKTSVRFDVSRNCYKNPSLYFKNYIKSILDQSVVIADMQGTGNSVKDFYDKNQKIIYIIGESFNNISAMTKTVPNAIERHNCTDIGPLINWGENGPVRGNNEHDSTAIRIQSTAVKTASNSISQYKFSKNINLLGELISLMIKNYTHKNVPYVKG